jgi:hypothetical protein
MKIPRIPRGKIFERERERESDDDKNLPNIKKIADLSVKKANQQIC